MPSSSSRTWARDAPLWTLAFLVFVSFATVSRAMSCPFSKGASKVTANERVLDMERSDRHFEVRNSKVHVSAVPPHTVSTTTAASTASAAFAGGGKALMGGVNVVSHDERRLSSDPQDGGVAGWRGLDTFFLSAYENASAHIFAEVSSEPVILVEGNNVVLQYTPEASSTPTRLTSKVIPNDYTCMKMSCHIAYSYFLLLDPLVYNTSSPDTKVPLTDATAKALDQFRDIVPPTHMPFPDNCELTSEQAERQLTILNSTWTYLNETLITNEVSLSQLSRFAHEVGDAVGRNINESAIAAVRDLNTTVMEWKNNYLTPAQWSQLRVLILASHMPRHNQMALQYFSVVLNTPIDSGLRVMYAENISTEKDAFALMATHVNDFAAGKAFFGVAEHMHSDILGPATWTYLMGKYANATNDLKCT